MEVSQTALELQDLALDLDQVTELQDSRVFRLKEGNAMPSYNEKDLVQGVILSLSLDQSLIERRGYTILDILSELGGLQGILISGISLILSVFNHKYLDNYLVSKLYES